MFGNNVSSPIAAKVTNVNSSTAKLTTGTGAIYTFTDKDVNGVYRSPMGLKIKLVKNGNGTWTATGPSAVEMNFTATGRLDNLTNTAGAIWTMSYDGGGKLESIQNPGNRTATIGYDGSSNLQKVTDFTGRVTTFTVDAMSGNLTKMTAPDGGETELVYDGSDRLQAYVDANDNRWTYAFDNTSGSRGMVSSIKEPLRSGDHARLDRLVYDRSHRSHRCRNHDRLRRFS